MDKFIVKCARKPRTKRYLVYFEYHPEIVDRIKQQESKHRKLITTEHGKVWLLHVNALYNLIKSYKKSTKIHFDFITNEAREKFSDEIKKIDKEEVLKKQKKIELEKNKKKWIAFKDNLDANYKQYIEETHKNLKEGVRLYPYQVAATKFIDEVKNVLLALDMGLGKANPIDSKLLTPNGWIRMGDVKVGDKLIGSDGKPINVIGVYPQGEKDIYEITFNDNTTAQSCDEHLWNVNSATRISRTNRGVKKYPYQTKTLREIINSGLQYDNGNNKYYIPIVKPIEFEEKKLNIDPYLLGCLLGDRCITQQTIGFTSKDKEIINEIQIKLPKKHNFKLKGCSSHNKFIPDEYKFSSIKQRLEILKGIMDTDGTISKDGMNIDLILPSKKLIDDVKFIVQSLGGIARYKTRTAWYEKVDIKPYHRLSIKLPPDIIPFKLKRKIERYISPTKYPPNRAMKSVKYIGKKEAQCIMVDAKDHLYVTDNCILTHNTLNSIAYVEMNELEKVFVITPNSLKFNYYNEVVKFTHSKAYIVTSKSSTYKNEYSIEESKYIIFNYDFFNPGDRNRLKAKLKSVGVTNIDAVILDECQAIKNTKSNTYKNFKWLFKDSFFRNKKTKKIFMSGTPAPNKSYELYTIMNQISSIDFPNKNHFYEYYCGMKYDYKNGLGWIENNDKKRLEQLFEHISPYTYRKRKKDVLHDLPDKTVQKIILELSPKEQAEYNRIEEDVAHDLETNIGSNPLTIMLRLRQFLSETKVKYVNELIDSILLTGEKVVVVDMFKKALYKLEEMYPNVCKVHSGDQKIEDRAKIIDKFQDLNDSLSIFAGSIPTCNYGLTLTAASKMIILTLPYSVGKYDQVMDRIHRISQKYAVNIYVIIFKGTIDEDVFTKLEMKRKDIVKVMDNEDYTTEIDESVLNDIVNKLINKHK